MPQMPLFKGFTHRFHRVNFRCLAALNEAAATFLNKDKAGQGSQRTLHTKKKTSVGINFHNPLQSGYQNPEGQRRTN